MIIQSSSVALNSERRFQTSTKTALNVTTWGSNGVFCFTGKDALENNHEEFHNSKDSDTEKKDISHGKKSSYEGLSILGENARNARLARMKSRGIVDSQDDYSSLQKVQNKLFMNLLRLLFGENSDIYKRYQNQDLELHPEQEFGGEITEFTSYSEYEELSFAANALVSTSDGRQINIDYNVHMSRSFYSAYSQTTGFGAAFCIDPLVISLDGTLPEFDSMDFYFDLDADGETDKISSLGKKSGYLAFDRNNDGIINDGSELFGATSGNGFDDLAAFDLDHNGWIDEADDIFSKLRVWVSAGSENARLLTLKEAGIGAICLKNEDSNYTLSDITASTNAYIRKSGIFLYESGMAGSISHIDVVKK